MDRYVHYLHKISHDTDRKFNYVKEWNSPLEPIISITDNNQSKKAHVNFDIHLKGILVCFRVVIKWCSCWIWNLKKIELRICWERVVSVKLQFNRFCNLHFQMSKLALLKIVHINTWQKILIEPVLHFLCLNLALLVCNFAIARLTISQQNFMHM